MLRFFVPARLLNTTSALKRLGPASIDLGYAIFKVQSARIPWEFIESYPEAFTDLKHLFIHQVSSDFSQLMRIDANIEGGKVSLSAITGGAAAPDFAGLVISNKLFNVLSLLDEEDYVDALRSIGSGEHINAYEILCKAVVDGKAGHQFFLNDHPVPGMIALGADLPDSKDFVKHDDIAGWITVNGKQFFGNLLANPVTDCNSEGLFRVGEDAFPGMNLKIKFFLREDL